MKWFILILIFSQVAVAQVPFDMIPGNFVRQGKIIWSCLPAVGSVLVCAPIDINKFCQIEKREFDKGILSCVKPLMAEDNLENDT